MQSVWVMAGVWMMEGVRMMQGVWVMQGVLVMLDVFSLCGCVYLHCCHNRHVRSPSLVQIFQSMVRRFQNKCRSRGSRGRELRTVVKLMMAMMTCRALIYYVHVALNFQRERKRHRCSQSIAVVMLCLHQSIALRATPAARRNSGRVSLILVHNPIPS